MPVAPGSRFAALPVLQVVAPDGGTRRVVALRLTTPTGGQPAQRYLVTQGETVDLLARRFLGDEGLWWRILDANPLRYGLDVEAGDVLQIPAPSAATRTTRARTF